MSWFTLADIGVQDWQWSVMPHESLPRTYMLEVAVPEPDGTKRFAWAATEEFLTDAGWSGAEHLAWEVTRIAAARGARLRGLPPARYVDVPRKAVEFN